MKSRYLSRIFAVMMVFLLLPGAVSATSTLSLVQKDPATWVQISGATGSLTYTSDGSSFVFDGQGLTDGIEYSLISYAEPYPGTGSLVLGTATTVNGNVHIEGTLALVLNTYSTGEYAGQTGAKIWLVPSSDLTTTAGITSFNAWNPAAYLFETHLIPVRDGVPTPEFPTLAFPVLVISAMAFVVYVNRRE